ncbi:MAG: substrate-binding domain-containing protein, partial [Chloroflexota bacterium]
SKMGHRGFAPVAKAHQLTHFLTDQDLPEETLAQLRRASVSVTVCGQNTIRSHNISTGKKKYVIGFANQSESLPFAVDVRQGLEKAVAQRGDVDLILTDNKLSSAEALRVANHLIEREVDLAIEYQIDYRGGNLIIDKFQRSRIPVIAVDIPMVGATFFGVDNYRAGYMAGEALGTWVKTNWDGMIDYLAILEEQRAGDLPKARIHGQQDAFEAVLRPVSSEKIITLDSGNTAKVSQQNMSEWLKSVSSASKIAVISFNDEAAVGAIRAARGLDREADVVVVGQGGDSLGRSEIQRPDSRLIGSTAYMPEKYGEMLVSIALRLLQGQPVPPAVYIDHIFLTAENLAKYYEMG